MPNRYLVKAWKRLAGTGIPFSLLSGRLLFFRIDLQNDRRLNGRFLRKRVVFRDVVERASDEHGARRRGRRRGARDDAEDGDGDRPAGGAGAEATGPADLLAAVAVVVSAAADFPAAAEASVAAAPPGVGSWTL